MINLSQVRNVGNALIMKSKKTKKMKNSKLYIKISMIKLPHTTQDKSCQKICATP